MNLYSLNCGYFKLDGGAMFGVVPKSIWNQLNPADENNLCSWALRSLLIEDEGRLILVDAGMGNKQSEKFFGYYYMHGGDTLEKSLAAHGFQRNDITDVILTHLHFDHCGGAIEKEGDRLFPAFKNATYWSNTEQWKWATNPNAREKASFLKENILPMKESGQLKFIDNILTAENKLASAPFSDKVQIRFTYGHTEAMMLPQIQYKGKTLVYMADFIPSSAHIPVNYVCGYDIRPLVSMDEKELFIKEALDNDYILFFEHDPVYECCSLQQTERGIRMKDSFRLNEL
jgi:glyoxylase-like metal-dependent hydrolase (beta-lactamase superfamily II)